MPFIILGIKGGRRMDWLIIAARTLVILFAVYCFLTAPNLFRRKLSHKQLTGHDYAHRGLHDNKRGVPENSLAAFRRAVQEGYGDALISALKKLARLNFANLNPHPLSVKPSYDHPPIAERIRLIRQKQST